MDVDSIPYQIRLLTYDGLHAKITGEFTNSDFVFSGCFIVPCYLFIFVNIFISDFEFVVSVE